MANVVLSQTRHDGETSVAQIWETSDRVVGVAGLRFTQNGGHLGFSSPGSPGSKGGGLKGGGQRVGGPTFRVFSRRVFSWKCGCGSRSWTTKIVRSGFSGVILCEPRRPQRPLGFTK